MNGLLLFSLVDVRNISIMDDEQTIAFGADGKNLVQLLWTTTSASPTTTEDAYFDEPRRELCFGHHKNLALFESLSESAPDLGRKLESTHQAAPQRLCKSADTLLTKHCKQQHHKQIRGFGRATCKGFRSYPKCGKRYEPYAEIETDRGGSCKSLPGVRSLGSMTVEKKMLQIGNFNRRTNPLDYTLCLADYKTNWNAQEHTTDSKAGVRLSIESLAKHLHGLLVGFTILHETDTGSIVGEFTNLEDMNRVIRLPLAKIFGTKVKSWRILGRYQYNNQQQPSQSSQLPQRHQRHLSPGHRLNNFNCHSYRRYLIAPDIPDTVPALEIQNALRFQGLRTGQVLRHIPGGFSIEVLRPCDYDRLCRDGVNFFNVAAFPVYPSSENLSSRYTVIRDGKCVDSKDFEPKSTYLIGPESVPEIPVAILQQTQHRENIQCFKCQRYGHKATHCKYWTRCVRCGGKHKVSDCDVPMASASCCLCKGAHHAASRECPVHNVHANAVQVTFVMARTDLKSSSFGDGCNIW